MLKTQVEEGPYSSELKTFYLQRAYEPAWIAHYLPTRQAHTALQFLSSASQHGLDPQAYDLSSLQPLFEKATDKPLTVADAITLDLLLTDAVLRLGKDLLQGRVDPRSLHSGWRLPSRKANLVTHLQHSLDTGTLAAMRPAKAPYPQLQQALSHYRTLAVRGGWPTLPAGPTLRPTEQALEVATLRTQLRLLGDLTTETTGDTTLFDPTLEQAVRAFQQRHGLDVDGLVGKQTRAALHVPVEARIRQIEVNLERLRWLPDSLETPYLLVNIADFSLRVFEADTIALAMRVIVGKKSTPTPVFSTRLTEVVLAPSWNIPASIIANEIEPLQKADSTYLARNHMKRLPGNQIRQDPGPWNTLGRVKFTITNPYDVGLHDTPSRYLFHRSTCAFSHGCMRIEKPVELAAYVLRSDTTWTPSQIEATIGRWKEKRIRAPLSLPLHVIYQTAWVDLAGKIHFREDLYGHDARLSHALQIAR